MGDRDVFLFLQLRVALQVVSSLRLPLSRNIQEEAECVVLAAKGQTLRVSPQCLWQQDCGKLITQRIGVRPNVPSLPFNLQIAFSGPEHVLLTSV